MRRHLLPFTGPSRRISSSTFCRFFSDFAYICSCHGVSARLSLLWPLLWGLGGAVMGVPATGLVIVMRGSSESGGGGLEVAHQGPAKGRELARGLVELGAGLLGAPAQLAGESSRRTPRAPADPARG